MKRIALAITTAIAFVAPNAHALTLDEALARRLEKNPTILDAKLALEQAAGRRLVLRSHGLPDTRIQILAGDQGGKRAGQSANEPFGFGRGISSQELVDAADAASRRRGCI